MILHFTIPTSAKKKMPNLNDLIKAERTKVKTRNGGFFTMGAKMKKEWQRYIEVYIRKDLLGQKVEKPFIVHFEYYEPDYRRDIGNVHATCEKFTMDALQEVGTIPNDNQKWYKGFTACFSVDKLNPRVEVFIQEIENDAE